MIKKSANYIMLFALLFSGIGISINQHCSGNLAHTSFMSVNEPCCQKDLCTCCNETNYSFKIEDAFLKPALNIKHLKTKYFKRQIKSETIIFREKSQFLLSEFNKLPEHFNINLQTLLQCFRL